MASSQELHRWIKTQRTMHHTEKLRPDRRRRLEDAGITLGDKAYKLSESGGGRKSESVTNEKKFELMLSALKTYKGKHGDCSVPRGWKQHSRCKLPTPNPKPQTLYTKSQALNYWGWKLNRDVIGTGQVVRVCSVAGVDRQKEEEGEGERSRVTA